ncbi:MAG: TonB-dependent receptor [Bacteroides sp.]|nr:TonB-dependent receptor [Bacteroides sp.]
MNTTSHGREAASFLRSRLFSLLTLLLFTFLSLHSQPRPKDGTLRGKVRYADGQPAELVMVIVKNFQLHTHTDEKGHFLIADIPHTAQLEIEVKALGCKPVNKWVDFAKGHQHIEITLQDAGDIALKEVSVKGKSASRQIREKGFAVDVVNTKELALRNLQTNELLDQTAGVRIRQDGGLGSRINYNINGLTGNAVKVFIDGVPATNYGRSFSLNSIPPSLIERIEVYKGVVPGHLSEDALGGAINVIMKKQHRSHVDLSYSYGSFNSHQAHVNAAHSTRSGWFANASAFYNYSDNDYRVWGEQITHIDYQGKLTRGHTANRFNDAFRSYGMRLETGWAGVKWADRFSVSLVGSNDYKEVQHGVTMQRVFGDRHSRRRAGVVAASYHKHDLWLKGLSVKVDAAYSHQRNQAIDTVGIQYDWRGPIRYPDGSPVRYSSGAEQGSRKTAEVNTNRSWAVRANVGYRIDKNNSVFVNHLFNDFDRGISDPYLTAALAALQNTRDLQKNITTLTFENQAFKHRLRTNLFYKHYYQAVTSNEPYLTGSGTNTYDVKRDTRRERYNGFGGTVSYAITPGLFVLSSAEKAIRFPDENEIFGNVATLINPSPVHAEQSFNINLGLSLTEWSVGAHHFKGNLSLFYRDTKGMIRQAETPGNTGTTYYENLEDVLTKGIDLELNYRWKDALTVSLNASKFDVLFNTPYNKKGEKYLYYKQQIRNEPSFKSNLSVAYYLKNPVGRGSRASIHYNLGYINKFNRNWSNVGATNLEIIPAQLSNNIGLVLTLPGKRITIGFDAKNIFNEQLYDNFGLQKPGRSFFGKITYQLL